MIKTKKFFWKYFNQLLNYNTRLKKILIKDYEEMINQKKEKVEKEIVL